ncbi:hypothetical protein J1G42_02805 [Cellulomonas sp. zg-ZUI222]|uniref:hypothetical protein n=1 Tax=Cellulomonas wangleii TaxID=2816956 RepID=UPI001A93EDBF|nr:hypothetical protein [Cellulomonas wangleii]MBO0919754.1 hypothetical protein [Cellulomonas wangleii]
MSGTRRAQGWRAVTGLVLVAAPVTACSAGERIEHTVVGTVVGSEPWETTVTLDPEKVAAGWSEAGGAPVPLPPGEVTVLLSPGGAVQAPTVSAVRAEADGWVLDVTGERLAPGCDGPAMVRSVTFLLHVRADAPPERARVEVTEHEVGC